MSSTIIIKNSATSGSIPASLVQGEFGINVTDGKLYYGSGSGNVVKEFNSSSFASFAISASHASTASFVNPLRQTVQITGSLTTTGSNTLIGNTFLTGSLNVTGSTTQTGNNTLIGNTSLSGSLIISGSQGAGTPTIQIFGDVNQTGYTRFLPVTTNIDTSISASYIYVSGSTQDLYFSQNSKGYNNVTRLRWLEGNLYTGLLNGGLITTQSSTVYQISSGSGIIVNLNASLNDNPYPTIQYLNWGNLSASIAPLTASYQQAFVSIDSAGNIYQQGTPYASGQFNTEINIGVVLFQNQSTINGVKTQPSLAYGFEQNQNIFNRAFGPLKLSGYTLAPSGSSTGSLIVGSGTAYSPGSNYPVDPNNPSYAQDSGTNVSKIFRYHQSGSTWVYNTNAGAGFGAIDPTRYSNNGALTLVPSPVGSNWTIQRVFWFPNSVAKAIVVYYGNNYYGSEAEAIANINIESFVEAPNTAANAIYLGAIVINGDGVFTQPNDFTIVPGGLFRQVGGSGGGGSVITQTLSGLSDVLISGPTNGQPLVYDTTAAKWENKSTLTATLIGNASTATSASFATTASFALSSAGGLTNFIERFSSATQATSFFSASNAAATVNAAIVPKGSGSLMAQVPDGTTTGGNARGVYAVDLQLSRTTNTHVASGPYSFLGGGQSNTSAATHSAVLGGQSNSVSATSPWSAVISGQSNSVNDTNSQGKSVVCGGASNSVTRGWSGIVAGLSNVVSQDNTFIGAGRSNTAGGIYAGIVSGRSNTTGADYVFIGAGQSNTANGTWAGVVAGLGNTAGGNYSIVGGGASNLVSGQYAMIVGGLLNTASADYTFASGRRAKATNQGSFVWADSADADFTSNGNNTFNVRATGGSFFTGSMTVTGSLIIAPASAVELEVTTAGVKIGNASNDAHTVTGSLGVAGQTRISGSFNTAVSGTILTVIGSGSTQPIFTVQGSQGELFSVTDSLTGSLFSVNDISGLPILEVFSDSTTNMGNYLAPALYTTNKITQTNSGSFVVYSLPTASYDGAFYDYTVRSGSNARAGQIMAIWSGSSVNFTETTTTSFGSTSAINFTVIVSGSNMVLTGSSATGSWTIKTIIRSI